MLPICIQINSHETMFLQLFLQLFVDIVRQPLNTPNSAHKTVILKAKKCFYRSANATFGTVGRIASEEVVLHLITTKCIPVLLYGLEVRPLTKAELHSLDYAVTRFVMKSFNTSSIAVIKDCSRCFSFKLPSELLEIRIKNLCSNVISDHARGYFVTHCALIELM